MLKIRTEYSFRSATGHLAHVFDKLKSMGLTHFPITDRASTYGFPKWNEMCKDAGVQPVFGVELAVSSNINVKKPGYDFWTFFAIDELQPIHELVELATSQFRYIPVLSIEQAIAVAGEGVEVIAGHRAMLDLDNPIDHIHIPLGPSTTRGVIKKAVENKWSLAATSDNRYANEDDRNIYEIIGGRFAEMQLFPQHILNEGEWRKSVSHHGLKKSQLDNSLSISQKILEMCNAKIIQAELPKPDRPKTLREMCMEGAIKKKIDLNDPIYLDRMNNELSVIELKDYEDYFYIVADMMQFARRTCFSGPARGSSAGSLVCHLTDITNVDPIKHNLIFERFVDVSRGGFRFSENFKGFKEFTTKSFKGDSQSDKSLLDHFIESRVDEFDKRQTLDELHAVLYDDLTGYFLAALKTKKKISNDINSVMAYVIGITDTKPKKDIRKSNLMQFDIDAPDIDSDISKEKRHLVYEYLQEKYGKDHVARIGLVAEYKPKSALKELGGSLRIPIWETEKVAGSIIPRKEGDSRSENTIEDTFTDTLVGKSFISKFPNAIIVKGMEAHARHHGVHAAGVLITKDPISMTVAIDGRSGAAMCDKKDAEKKLGFVKIDLLGLRQLSVFDMALELAGLSRDYLDTIDLEDAKVFKSINDKKFSGVFQFEGRTMRAVSNRFELSEFEDFVSITALARPGPLVSGQTDDWVSRKKGLTKVEFTHKLFEPYLKSTLGVVIYQEQIQQIGRDIGGLSWQAVSGLRKAMSKSMGSEYFDQFGDPWKKGAIKKGIPKDVADQTWIELCSFGSMAFNRSHAVSYGLISYHSAHLKAYYPLEYLAASLTFEEKPDRQIQMLRELVDEGFDYVPLDADHSTDRWEVAHRGGKKILVGPLQNCKGFGPALVRKTLEARSAGEPLPKRAQTLLKAAITPIDSLYPVAKLLKRLLPDPLTMNIKTPFTDVGLVRDTPMKSVSVIVGMISKIDVSDENSTIKVANRGYRITQGNTTSLIFTVYDDTGQLLCKISRQDYERVGHEIANRGRLDKALYVFKGSIFGTATFRIFMIKRALYLGDVDPSHIDKVEE